MLLRALSSHARTPRLLTPYALSRRVDALCKQGSLDAAAALVKSSPLAAQNAVVWATLLAPVLAAGRHQEAYRLFIDMKRRGIRPASRTFSTLLKGYAQIDDWPSCPVQLDNVCSVYTQLKQHHWAVTQHGGPREELSNIPYNLLITIFGKAQRFQHMFDVFNAMPASGPLAPDMHTFTVLLSAIGNRQPSAFTASPPPSPTELAYKNAADARLVWRQLLRVCPAPDSHAVRAILRPLARGRPSDHALALAIAHDHLGLPPPGTHAHRPPHPLPPLHEHTLDALLHTTHTARRHRHTLHYIQHIIDTHRAHVLTRRHMDHALHAHAALACTDPGEAGQALETLQWMLRMRALPRVHARLRRQEDGGGLGRQMAPAASSYDAAVLACLNAGDWAGACRVLELMTGCDCAAFRSGGEASRAGAPPRVRPSAVFMSCFIRAAAKTRQGEHVRMALDILDWCGVDGVLGEGGASAKHMAKDHHRVSQASRLVEALRVVMPRMLASGAYGEEAKARWRAMVRRVEGCVGGAGVPEV